MSPPPPPPGFDFVAALRRLVAVGGSDLHLKAGNRPLMRVHGELDWVDENLAPLTAPDTEQLLHEILPASRIKEFEYAHEVDAAYSVPGLARFRLNAYRQRGSVSMVLRTIPHAVKTLADLDLPEVVGRLAAAERGIVLVTGTTGCGKSTTLAAMIAQINATARKHIVTIEDPIEYLYTDDRSSIDQREVGTDTESFQSALRRVLRQDPDVILIGEMRDEETVRTALSAAETGHLVLSTLHTVDATETINRILDFFPPHEKQPIRAMLGGTLQGIVSQRLVPAATGEGRAAICEVLVMTGRTHDMIMDPEKTGDLATAIAEGEYYGMQTFDQALYAAVSSGRVALDEAIHYATRPHDFKLLVSAEGHLGTTMDDIYPEGAQSAHPSS